MPRNILGINIGPDSADAVKICSSLRGRPQITGAASISLNEDCDLSSALAVMAGKGLFDADMTVASLSLKDISIRNLELPFSDPVKIKQVLAYELEPLIPFPVEEMSVDCLILRPGEHSEVMAAAAPKTAVQERVASLVSGVPGLAIMEMESLPIALSLLDSNFGTTLLLDIGSQGLSAIVIDEKQVRLLRFFALPSGWEAAELQSSLGELKKTLDMLGATGQCPVNPGQVLVTGRNSRTEGVRGSVTKCFGAPAEQLDLAGRAQIANKTGESWDPPAMNAALALALRGLMKTPGMDFLTGEFRPPRKAWLTRKDLQWCAAAAALALIVLSADFGLGMYIEQVRLDRLKSEVGNVVKRNVPDAPRNAEPVQLMKAKIAEARRFSFAHAGADGLFLDFLNEISRLVPSGANFRITQFQYDSGKIELRAETASFDMAEEIKKALAGSRYFRNVTISSANLGKQGGGVELSVKLDLVKT